MHVALFFCYPEIKNKRGYMKKIQILAPIKNKENLVALKSIDRKKLGLKGVYIYHDYFLKEGFDKIHAFYDVAQEMGLEFYINFKNSIDEKQMNDFISKMTPFFSIFLDNGFGNKHYETKDIVRFAKR